MNFVNEQRLKSLPRVWHCAGGNNSRCSLFPDKVKIKGKPSFVIKMDGSIFSPVVFDGKDKCFVSDASGVVACFNQTGESLWRMKLDSEVFAGMVHHPEKQVLFAGTAGGFLYALNSQDGQVIWKRQIPTSSDPRILSNLIYVGKIDSVVLSSWGGRFVAIRSFDGVEKFAWNAGLYPSSGAASDSDGNIYSLRAVEGSGVELVKVSADGKETIMFRQEESRRGARRTLVWASPVLDEVAKIIYFVINHDRGAILYAFSMVADRVLWKSVLPISVQASPVLSGDGLITLFDLRGMTLCFTVEGSLKYNYYTGCEYLVAAGAADISGTIYLGDTQGKIHVIDENGKGKVILETERSIQARPAFSPTGDLFIPSTDHNVYVFRNAG